MLPSLKDICLLTIIRNNSHEEKNSLISQSCLDAAQSCFIGTRSCLFYNDGYVLPSDLHNDVLLGIMKLWSSSIFHKKRPLLFLEFNYLLNTYSIKNGELCSTHHKFLGIPKMLQSLQKSAYFSFDLLTTVNFDNCHHVTDIDLKAVIEKCCNLSTLSLAWCSLVTDDLFEDLILPKKVCSTCSNTQFSSFLKLKYVTLSNCTEITTKTVRNLWRLCGPNLQKLDLSFCSNVYITALWYLCGIFKGKEKFLKSEIEIPGEIECSCNYENHKNIFHPHETQLTLAKSTSVESLGDSQVPIPSTASTKHSVVEFVHSFKVLQKFIDSLCRVLIPFDSAMEFTLTDNNLLASPEPIINGHDEGTETSPIHVDMNSILTRIKALGFTIREQTLTFLDKLAGFVTMETSAEPMDTSKEYLCFSALEILKKCTSYLDLMDEYCGDLCNELTYEVEIVQSDKDANLSALKEIVEIKDDVLQSFGDTKDSLLKFIIVIRNLTRELKENRDIKAKLSAIFINASFCEEDVLISVDSLRKLVNYQIQQLAATTEENISSSFVSRLPEATVAEASSSNEPVNGVPETRGEMQIDDSSPDLIDLLEEEVILVLRNSQHTHCPDCCTNAYLPRLEYLDISNIAYQSSDVFDISVKTFAVLNCGLEYLNLGWTNVSNETLAFLVEHNPEIKSLVVKSCEQLNGEFLLDISHHTFELLDMFGIHGVEDMMFLPFISRNNLTNLTSLNLAEAAITDFSLLTLRSCQQLKSLNLNWCDDVTDHGISELIYVNASTLQHLLLRQCSIGEKTVSALECCPKLVKLDISTALELNEDSWKRIVNNVPYLEVVDLGWVSGITNSMLTEMFTHCFRLRTVILDGNKNITEVPLMRILVTDKEGEKTRSCQYIPYVKYVSLQYCNDMNDDNLHFLVTKCRGSLTIQDYYGSEIMFLGSTSEEENH